MFTTKDIFKQVYSCVRSANRHMIFDENQEYLRCKNEKLWFEFMDEARSIDSEWSRSHKTKLKPETILNCAIISAKLNKKG